MEKCSQGGVWLSVGRGRRGKDQRREEQELSEKAKQSWLRKGCGHPAHPPHGSSPVTSSPFQAGAAGSRGGVTRRETRARRSPLGGAGRGLPGAYYISQNPVRLRRLAPRARLEDWRPGIGPRHPAPARNGAPVGRSIRIG